MTQKVDSWYHKTVVNPGDRVSAIGRDVCVRSFRNCPAVEVIPRRGKDFRGPVDFRWKKHILEAMLRGEMAETGRNDGAGGKTQFAPILARPEDYGNLRWELIEMCAMDILRDGGYPAIMFNQVDAKGVNEKNMPYVEGYFLGYSEALHQAMLVNLSGETALMGTSITAFSDWGDDSQLICTLSGMCIGLTHKKLQFCPEEIVPGMYLVGIFEHGYRCNGGSLLANIVQYRWSTRALKARKDPKLTDFLRGITVPSLPCTPTLRRILGWNADGSAGEPVGDIMGIAHITGGGFWERVKKLLPEGIGARCEKMPRPPKVLLQAQRYSWDLPDENKHLSDWACHGVFHGGCAAVIACATLHGARAVIRELRRDGLPSGIIGQTTKSQKQEIVLNSKFLVGGTLSSLEPQ